MTDQKTTQKKASNKPRSRENQEIWRAFVACPRCSFFLTGYDLIHDDLAGAMAETAGKWLELTWSISTRKLVQKSYGVMINRIDSHFEGVCTDCQRIYIYDASDNEPPEISFVIKINPAR